MVRSMSAPTLPDVFTVSVESSREPFKLHSSHLLTNFTSTGLLQSVTSQGHTLPVSLEFVKYGVK